MAATSSRVELQEPMPKGYHILKITYEHKQAASSTYTAISDTAILLLPIPSDPSHNINWQQAKIYYTCHSAPMETYLHGVVVLNSANVELILGPTRGVSYLFYAAHNGEDTRERCVLSLENENAFIEILADTNPLWDEYAIVHTSHPTIMHTIFKLADIGTFADQVVNNLTKHIQTQPRPYPQPLFCWEPQVLQGLGEVNVVDRELDFTGEVEKVTSIRSA